jgi:hypothetical protein
MQEFQSQATTAGHIWITINTGGKVPDLKNAVIKDQNKATVVIDDTDGTIAKII